jgi:hypothetical protein
LFPPRKSAKCRPLTGSIRHRNSAQENVMAKGQMRSNKEKKKPKADKNKKKEGSSSSFGMAQNQGQPGSNPYGKKGP